MINSSNTDFKPRRTSKVSKTPTEKARADSRSKKSSTAPQESYLPADSTNQADDIPLMDEVKRVIEQEKTLISLQLLEQQRAAQEWKQKYDQLIETVVTDASSGAQGSLRAMEAAADSLSSSAAPVVVGGIQSTITQPTNIDRGVLIHHVDESGYILDVSGLNLDAKSLNEVNKLLNEKAHSDHGDQQSGSPKLRPLNVRTVVMRSCDINDRCIESMAFIVGNPKLKAIDLSHNNIGILLQAKMLESLKTRQHPPEYILLHANKSMSQGIASPGSNNDKTAAAKRGNKQFWSMGNIVQCVSSSTWGITVTLEDFDPMISIENHHPKVHQTNTHAAHDINQPASHLMLSHGFLKAINKALDPFGDDDHQHTTDASTKRAAPKPELSQGRRGLQLISVLGLMYAQLSKQTIKELCRTMTLASSTLTDLDLSFSYIGYYGVTLLCEVLSQSDSQIIRLGLAGNDVGNAGAVNLCQALAMNSSVTYVDLQSNNITDDGLLAMAEHLSKAKVLYQLCLNGNNRISQEAMFHVERYLYYQGSDIRLKWSTSNQQLLPNHRFSLLDPERILYNVPQKKTMSISSLGSSRLYAINLRIINPVFKENEGRPLAFSWLWRPAAKKQAPYSKQSYAHARIKIEGPPGNQSADSANHGDESTGSQPSLPVSLFSYELRIRSHLGDVVTSIKRPVPPSKALLALQEHSSDESSWIESSIPLMINSKIPLQGELEIHLHFHTSQTIFRDFEFQSSRLVVFAMPPSIDVSSAVSVHHENDKVVEASAKASVATAANEPRMELIGGDYRGWSDAASTAIASSTLYSSLLNPYRSSLPRDFSVLRVFQWHSSDRPEGIISLAAKLKAISHVNKFSAEASTADTPLPTSQAAAEVSVYSFGYEINIIIISSLTKTVRSAGSISSTSDPAEVQKEAKSQASNHTLSEQQKREAVEKVLQPWNWSIYSFQLANMRPNDLVVVMGKAFSASTTVPDHEASTRSLIAVKDCSLHVRSEPVNEGKATGTVSRGRRVPKDGNNSAASNHLNGLLTSVYAVHNDPFIEFNC